MEFKDQMNQVFELQKTPKRIISLVPSITELLVDLGLENSLVGVTKFCVHPAAILQTKTIVGGTKNCNFDKIKALKPDIILCNKEENTQEIVTLCKEIAPTHVSDIFTIADTLQVIHQYGEIFSCTDKSKDMIVRILEKHNNFLDFMSNKTSKKVAYFIWKNPWMVAANNTFINYLLETNKFENAFIDKERYPIIEFSEITNIKNLDCIFLSSEPYPFKEKDILALQQKIENVKIILVDGEAFSWYGSRLLTAFDYFTTLQEKI